MMRSVVTLAGAALVATGCGSVVTVDGTGGSGTGGSGTGGSGTAGGGGSSGFVHGVVRLTHLLETSVGAWEQLALSAAFYAQPWDPDAPVSGFVDTV
ncbi:MAG: hypothetical protein IT373_06205, partial [Polyangiaceae bacterium]|nr:hypothetical protein [Polyangiaceae bacterium]